MCVRVFGAGGGGGEQNKERECESNLNGYIERNELEGLGKRECVEQMRAVCSYM